MMMHMLQAGGIPALSDGLRPADRHNPHGYFEYEPVKRLAQDSSWLEGARGKAVKVIYRLLVHLPPQVGYRVIFMRRNLTEVFQSQSDMLRATDVGTAGQDRDRLIPALAAELRSAREWLAKRPEIPVMDVPYAGVVRDPAKWSHSVAEFLGGNLDEPAMAAVVDAALYRHREPGL
jgi:hypothetical protein